MSRRWLLLLASLPLGALLFVAAATGGPPPPNTPPVVDVTGATPVEASGPSGAVIIWSVTVNDAEDDPEPAADCGTSPASGSTQPIGSHEVGCNTTDSGGLPGSDSLSIVVQDMTAPAVTPPGDVTAPATSSSGATVSYSGALASDAVSGSPPVSCAPASGSVFPLGATTVTCTATDGAGNEGSASFTVTVMDQTDPILNLPSNISVESTSPTAVSYSASASDDVDPSVAAICSPGSGSTFPFGTTTVDCTATDDSGNQAEGSFAVTVQDPGAPVVTVPANITVEANGPTGSSVSFPDPASAVDNKDGALLADCNPSAGATFPIGSTTVTCSVTDSDGKTGSGSFTITVQDTTAPILILPGNPIIQSPGPVASESVVISSFLSSASAVDLVDTSVPVTNNAPSSYPVGATTVTFTGTDDAGNTATATRVVNVVTTPTPGAVLPTQPIPVAIQPDAPPGNVRAVAAKIGHRSIQLSWTNPADADFDRVEIMRTPGKRGTPQSLVYRGAAPKFRDDSLAAGQEYRYLLVSIDSKGNRAVGVALVVVARAQLLLAPKDAARVKAPPLLRWKAISTADYYNVQLFRGKAKLLSVWPLKPSYKLKARWRYGGKSFRLTPGLYTWFVWPGEGALAKADYGALLGEGHFTVVKKKGG